MWCFLLHRNCTCSQGPQGHRDLSPLWLHWVRDVEQTASTSSASSFQLSSTAPFFSESFSLSRPPMELRPFLWGGARNSWLCQTITSYNSRDRLGSWVQARLGGSLYLSASLLPTPTQSVRSAGYTHDSRVSGDRGKRTRWEVLFSGTQRPSSSGSSNWEQRTDAEAEMQSKAGGPRDLDGSPARSRDWKTFLSDNWVFIKVVL